MKVAVKRVSPPSDDKRWKLVDVTMRRNGYSAHALIETLHVVQNSFGYLDGRAMRYVARSLRIPLSRVYGVATFYHLFSLEPTGEHTCVVCTGTACYIKGAPDLIDAVEDQYDVSIGGTTADGRLSLLSARCLGACGLAPAVVVDGEIRGRQTSEALLQEIGEATCNSTT